MLRWSIFKVKYWLVPAVFLSLCRCLLIMEITSLIDSSFIRSVKKSLFVPELLRMNAIVGREEPRLIVTKERPLV